MRHVEGAVGETEHRIRDLARRQFGLVTWEQTRRLGLGRGAIAHRVEAGEWQRVHRGVFRLSGTPVTWSQAARAATLLCGTGSALSHQPAAFLYGLDGAPHRPPARLDLSVSRSRCPGPVPFALHRSRTSTRVHWHRGLPVTPLAETLCDLSASLSPLDLELALDSARRQYPASVRWLTQRLLDRHHRGRAGLTVLRELVALRLEGPTGSPLETRVRRALREAGVPTPRRQLELFDATGFIMRVDFAWPDHLVALHVDSYRWHHQRERFERDAFQRARLAALGWQSVAVTSRSLDSGECLAALKTVLDAKAPQLALFGSRFPAAPWAQTS